MRANLLTDGRYGFMKVMTFPLEVECEISPRGNVAVTPAQLEAAGVPNVPTKFCAEVWYFAMGTEAIIIEDTDE